MFTYSHMYSGLCNLRFIRSLQSGYSGGRMSRPYRYLSFVPSRPTILDALAVTTIHNNFLSFKSYHSTSPSLGVYHVLIYLSLRSGCDGVSQAEALWESKSQIAGLACQDIRYKGPVYQTVRQNNNQSTHKFRTNERLSSRATWGSSPC